MKRVMVSVNNNHATIKNRKENVRLNEEKFPNKCD